MKSYICEECNKRILPGSICAKTGGKHSVEDDSRHWIEVELDTKLVKVFFNIGNYEVNDSVGSIEIWGAKDIDNTKRIVYCLEDEIEASESLTIKQHNLCRQQVLNYIQNVYEP